MDYKVCMPESSPQIDENSLPNELDVHCTSRILRVDDKWAAKNSKVDLAFMASIWAPSCNEDALRVMVDWNHWVRPASQP